MNDSLLPQRGLDTTKIALDFIGLFWAFTARVGGVWVWVLGKSSAATVRKTMATLSIFRIVSGAAYSRKSKVAVENPQRAKKKMRVG